MSIETNDRPEIPDDITPSTYFNDLIINRINKSPIPKIKTLNVLVEFHVSDIDRGRWGLVIEEGIAKNIIHVENNDPNPYPKAPTCTFTMNSKIFMAIVRKEISPKKAFFTRKIDVSGNIFLALKANVLVSYL